MPRFESDLTPDQRCREIATILAAGLLRYHRRVQPHISPHPDISDHPQNGLALSPERWLHAPTAGPREPAGQRDPK
jgi:hypothetical protein